MPAAAAPLAVAWPHAALAFGLAALAAVLPAAFTNELPAARASLAALVLLTAWIGVDGDGRLARAGGAGLAIVAALAFCARSAGDVRLAASAFAFAAGGAALVGALAGVSGAHADLLAGGAAIGLALAAGTRSWAVAALDLAGVLALPSRAGVAGALAVALALPLVRRRARAFSLAGATVVAVAWAVGAPPARTSFVHGGWHAGSGFADAYHRVGVVGVVLLVLLLAALLRDLPRDLAPAALAAAAALVLAPLEASAPLLFLVGVAAAAPAYDRAVASERERRLDEIERRLAAELRDLDAQRLQLVRRVAALDRREQAIEREVSARAHDLAERLPPPTPPPPPPQERPKPAPPPPPQPKPAGEPAPPPPPEPRQPARFRPTRPPAGPVPTPRGRGWSISRLERLVAEHGSEYPDRVPEWRTYLDALRPEALDDQLPERFDALVREVFGPLLDAPSG